MVLEFGIFHDEIDLKSLFTQDNVATSGRKRKYFSNPLDFSPFKIQFRLDLKDYWIIPSDLFFFLV